jgi:AsmA protein
MEGAATVVNMRLDGQGMPVDDVESLLPALGVTLPSGSRLKGGTLSGNLGIVGPTDKLVISGPVKLENTTLTGFDLGGKLGALAAFTGKSTSSKDTVIQNFSADVRQAPEGTRTDNINLNVPSLGVVTGSGTISPEGALNYHMVANLGGVAGGLTQVVSFGGGKGGGIPFMIEGTTSDPKFVPDVKGLAGGALQGVLGGKQGQNPVGALEGLFKKKP